MRFAVLVFYRSESEREDVRVSLTRLWCIFYPRRPTHHLHSSTKRKRGHGTLVQVFFFFLALGAVLSFLRFVFCVLFYLRFFFTVRHFSSVLVCKHFLKSKTVRGFSGVRKGSAAFIQSFCQLNIIRFSAPLPCLLFLRPPTSHFRCCSSFSFPFLVALCLRTSATLLVLHVVKDQRKKKSVRVMKRQRSRLSPIFFAAATLPSSSHALLPFSLSPSESFTTLKASSKGS